MDNKTYLGSQEVCAQLDIHQSTLSRWVAAGRIVPAMKMPGASGAFLFDQGEVDRLAQELAA